MGDLTTEPLVRTRKLGAFTLHALNGGLVRLDGGAMFGVVPKPLWEKRIPPDDRNRIPLRMRCLLIETADALVLVDNGAGNKESDKFIDIYGLDNASSDSARATRLDDALAEVGFSAGDVDTMIDTHLHFDHSGGNTYRDAQGEVHASFPNARYIVQQREWDFAHLRNERIQASYLRPNFDLINDVGQFDFVVGETEIVPGVRVVPTPGHTPHHQSVIVASEGETACFLADLVPTTAHLPLPWIMGYDIEPLVTLESKRALLAKARAEEWLLVFEHDASVAWGRLSKDDERPRLVEEGEGR